MDMFRTNPMREVVEDATSEMLLGSDWNLNAEIWEKVNQQPDVKSKEVVQAIRKRLKNSNPKVQLLCLELLDSLVKNCGDWLHEEVGSRDFMGDLIKIAKSDKKQYQGGEGIEVQERVLELIQTWSEQFRSRSTKLPMFQEAYEHLKRENKRFPARNIDAMSPVFTPPAHSTNVPASGSHPHAEEAPPPVHDAPPVQNDFHFEDDNARVDATAGVPVVQGHPVDEDTNYEHSRHRERLTGEFAADAHESAQHMESAARVPVTSTVPSNDAAHSPRGGADKVQKLREDLKLVREHERLLTECLDNMSPGESVSGNDLLQDLTRTMKAMHDRIQRLIERVSSDPPDETLLGELFDCNDSLFATLQRVSEMENRERATAAQDPAPNALGFVDGARAVVPQQRAPVTSVPVQSANNNSPLLDLSDLSVSMAPNNAPAPSVPARTESSTIDDIFGAPPAAAPAPQPSVQPYVVPTEPAQTPANARERTPSKFSPNPALGMPMATPPVASPQPGNAAAGGTEDDDEFGAMAASRNRGNSSLSASERERSGSINSPFTAVSSSPLPDNEGNDDVDEFMDIMNRHTGTANVVSATDGEAASKKEKKEAAKREKIMSAVSSRQEAETNDMFEL